MADKFKFKYLSRDKDTGISYEKLVQEQAKIQEKLQQIQENNLEMFSWEDQKEAENFLES